MAPQSSSLRSPLRAITQRLASTPTKQLPHIVPFLANSISHCGDVLANTESSQSNKDDPEVGILLHKFKTQLSTLLQDKEAESRWSAIVLIKATIEVGGWETLQGAAPWVRGLLGILNKSDPASTKKLCILTLTRIFLLTHDYQSLAREITTPSLPLFITSCLNSVIQKGASPSTRKVESSNSLLETVLYTLFKLLPHHPTLFRPFLSQLRSLLGRLLAPTPSIQFSKPLHNMSWVSPTAASVLLAQRLHALLPQCAPKNNSNEEWSKTMRTMLVHIHRTADCAFRSIVEDWTPAMRHAIPPGSVRDPGEAIHDKIDDVLELPGWSGIYAGTERLTGLFHLLQAHIAMESSYVLNLPVGSILSAAERILSIMGPSTFHQYRPEIHARLNLEIGKEEREGLWSVLPQIHVSAIGVVTIMVARMERSSMSFAQSTLERILWIHQHEQAHLDVRSSTYHAVAQLLDLIGPSLSKATVSSMASMIRTVCADLVPPETLHENSSKSVTNGSNLSTHKRSSDNADSYLKSSTETKNKGMIPSQIQVTANALLPLFLSRLPIEHLPFSLRSLIDRTAVLSQNEMAMTASVLNPPIKKRNRKDMSSIAPLLARAYPQSQVVEAILRPRMPVLQQPRNSNGGFEPDEDEDVTMLFEPGNVATESGNQSLMAGISDIIDLSEPVRDETWGRIVPALRMNKDIAQSTPQSQSQLSVPTKRDRDPVRTETRLESTVPQQLSPGDRTAKRVRVQPPLSGVSEDATQSSNSATDAAAGPEKGLRSAAEDSGSVNASDAEEDSEDSFEVPPIILDSDTDEEEDEEGGIDNA